jgi:hypothetical protein
MLQGFNDLLVCDLLTFSFPIELNQEDSSKLFSFQPSIVKNHSGAKSFPKDMVKYFKKEVLHEAIIGPFTDCPFFRWNGYFTFELCGYILSW